jgi:hypothetical protein
VEEMKTKEAFKTTNKSSHMRPIEFQLLVFLYRIGSEGSGGSCGKICTFFGIGKGSVKNYVQRTVSALHEIIDEVVVQWPDSEERKK